MTTKREHRVPVDNGKYTFIVSADHDKIVVYRYGEAWHEQAEAHNAIRALMCGLDAARGVVAAVRRLVEDWRAGAQARLERALQRHDRLVSDRSPPSSWAGEPVEEAEATSNLAPPPLDDHAQFLLDEHERELREITNAPLYATTDGVRAIVRESAEQVADSQGLDEVRASVRDDMLRFADSVAVRVAEKLRIDPNANLGEDERELLALLRGDPSLLETILGAARAGARTTSGERRELLEARMFALGRGYRGAAARIGRLLDHAPNAMPVAGPGPGSSAERVEWPDDLGAEAEKLRRGIEDVVADDDLTSGQVRQALRDLLDRVDASDSVTHLRRQEAIVGSGSALVTPLRAVDAREAGRLTPGSRPVTGRTLRAFLLDLETNDRTGAFDREVVLRLPIDGEAYVGGLRVVRVDVECDEEPAIVLDGTDGVAVGAQDRLVSERTAKLSRITRIFLMELLSQEVDGGELLKEAWEECVGDAERDVVRGEIRSIIAWLWNPRSAP